MPAFPKTGKIDGCLFVQPTLPNTPRIIRRYRISFCGDDTRECEWPPTRFGFHRSRWDPREALVIRVYPTQTSTHKTASIPTHMRAVAQTGQPSPIPPYPDIIAVISFKPERCRADDPMLRPDEHPGEVP